MNRFRVWVRIEGDDEWRCTVHRSEGEAMCHAFDELVADWRGGKARVETASGPLILAAQWEVEARLRGQSLMAPPVDGRPE